MLPPPPPPLAPPPPPSLPQPSLPQAALTAATLTAAALTATSSPHCRTPAVCRAASNSLSTLDLSENGVGDRGAVALAQALEAAPAPRMPTPEEVVACGSDCVQTVILRGLGTLNLAANAIGPAGARAIGRCLRRRDTLHTLRLQKNALGDEGVAMLAEGLLAEGAALQEIGLAENGVSRRGVYSPSPSHDIPPPPPALPHPHTTPSAPYTIPSRHTVSRPP